MKSFSKLQTALKCFNKELTFYASPHKNPIILESPKELEGIQGSPKLFRIPTGVRKRDIIGVPYKKNKISPDSPFHKTTIVMCLAV